MKKSAKMYFFSWIAELAFSVDAHELGKTDGRV